MNKKILILLYILIISLNAFAQIFPSYTSLNINDIKPYYLSTHDNADSLSDIRRSTFEIRLYNTSILMISTYRDSGITQEMIDEQINILIYNLVDWNCKLNFLSKYKPDNTHVYRIFDDIGNETFVTLFVNPERQKIDVYPLDAVYSLGVYDYITTNYEEGINGFLITIADGWHAQEVRIGDVDGDGMVDAFLAEGDPIYQNIDGNLEIVGYCGEFEE